MNKFFASPKFWGVYSIVYFVLMMIACVIAEGHVTGGGGESDVTVWAFDWQGWNSMNTADTFKMFCFLIIQMLPWLLAIIAPPKGKIYSVLLLLHLIIGLLLAIIYVGEVVYG